MVKQQFCLYITELSVVFLGKFAHRLYFRFKKTKESGEEYLLSGPTPVRSHTTSFSGINTLQSTQKVNLPVKAYC